MSFSFRDSALVIVGHGSTLNPDSSAPTLRCADEIRKRGLFAEVHCAFWKEEPSMREVFYSVRSEVVFIVPNFISEGYFTREVLPRELRLEGPVTRRDGKTFVYCDPVGIHPHMTRLLLHRADEVAPGVPRHETSLVIVGHGTGLNEQSRKAIEAQVAFIRSENHGFAEVLDAYMEEAPLIANWAELTRAPNVVVVPFFIADGLHSYQDIPVLLGMEAEPTAAASQNEVFRHNPHPLRGKNLFYSSAVGTDPLMVDVILDQAADAAARVTPLEPAASTAEAPTAWPDTTFDLGQVRAVPQTGGGWVLHHVEDDAAKGELEEFRDPGDARAIALHDEAGSFRPLKTAPNLKRGWRLLIRSKADLDRAFEGFYPGATGLWRHFRRGSLHPVPLRDTLGRQTGMYRFAKSISDDDSRRMVQRECDPGSKCLRRITWNLNATEALGCLPAGKLPPAPDGAPVLLCVEACTHLVSAAREIARANHLAKNPENP